MVSLDATGNFSLYTVAVTLSLRGKSPNHGGL